MNEMPQSRTTISNREMNSIYDLQATYVNRLYVVQDGATIRIAFTEDVAGQGESGDTYPRCAVAMSLDSYMKFATTIGQHVQKIMAQMQQAPLPAGVPPSSRFETPMQPNDDDAAKALEEYKANMAKQNSSALKYGE